MTETKTFDIRIKATIETDKYSAEDLKRMLIAALLTEDDSVILDGADNTDTFRVIEYHETIAVETSIDEPYTLD